MPDHRLVEDGAAHRAAEGGIAEGEDPPVGGHQPVAVAGRRGGDAHDRLVERRAGHRAMQRGVAEGVDAPVRAHQPVAVAGRGGGHADHRGGEGLTAHRAAERRHPRRRRPPRRRPPASSPGRRGWRPCPRPERRGGAAHRPEERGVAEAEDPPVGGRHPVAGAGRGGGHAHHRLVEVGAAHRALERGVSLGEDAAVGGRHPVAARSVGGGRCGPAGRSGARNVRGGEGGRPGHDPDNQCPDRQDRGRQGCWPPGHRSPCHCIGSTTDDLDITQARWRQPRLYVRGQRVAPRFGLIYSDGGADRANRGRGVMAARSAASSALTGAEKK